MLVNIQYSLLGCAGKIHSFSLNWKLQYPQIFKFMNTRASNINKPKLYHSSSNFSSKNVLFLQQTPLLLTTLFWKEAEEKKLFRLNKNTF